MEFNFFFQDSDGDKSDDNLVVDVSNEVTTLFIKLYVQSDLWEKEVEPQCFGFFHLYPLRT